MCRHTCLIKWTSVELYQSILCPVNILEWPRLKTVAQGVVYVLSSRVAPNEISTLWDPFTQWDSVFHLFFFLIIQIFLDLEQAFYISSPVYRRGWLWVYLEIHVQARGQCWVSFSLSTLIFETRSLTEPDGLDRIASKSQGSFCRCR